MYILYIYFYYSGPNFLNYVSEQQWTILQKCNRKKTLSGKTGQYKVSGKTLEQWDNPVANCMDNYMFACHNSEASLLEFCLC